MEEHDFLHPDHGAQEKTLVYGIDASSANKEKKTGVEWYAFYLIEAMKQHTLAKEERVILFSPTPLQGELANLPAQWESRVLSWRLPRGWMQGRVSWEMWRRPVNVLFIPSQGLPLISPRDMQKQQATVTTIHDLGFLRRPDVYPSSLCRRLRSVTRRAALRASHILTPSIFTKQEVMDVYHVASEKITVTPLAPNHALYTPRSEEEKKTIVQTYRLSPHYFLFIGRLEAKKNILTLLRAFEQYKERRGQGDPFELVLAGFPGYKYQEIDAFYKASPFKSSIRFLGYVPEEEIPILISQATASITPSWYEGFGIPNLEAAACGAPIIVSDIPAHREVMGEAGLFVPPADIEAWAKALTKIVDDPILRSTLQQKGLARAAQFSFAHTAEQTWGVLRASMHS